METKKTQPNAFKWLSEGLQEYATQSIKSDTAAIASKIEMTDRAVRSYLRGEVLDLETGKKILAELKTLIMQREKSVKKLVA